MEPTNCSFRSHSGTGTVQNCWLGLQGELVVWSLRQVPVAALPRLPGRIRLTAGRPVTFLLYCTVTFVFSSHLTL